MSTTDSVANGSICHAGIEHNLTGDAEADAELLLQQVNASCYQGGHDQKCK